MLVERRPVVVGEGGALHWGDVVLGEGGELHWGDGKEDQELPEEWVLRPPFRNANLDDDNEVVDLLQNFGKIERRDDSDTDLVPHNRWPLMRHQLTNADGKHEEWDLGEVASVEDARWRLKKARALAGVWREAMFDRPVAPALAAEGLRTNTDGRLDSEHLAWQAIAAALNEGLRPFQARVEHTLKLYYGGRTGEYIEGLPRVDLYSAACRQIFNLIVEDGTARLCENETCSVVFVHQIGGSKYGQYRTTGLRFCSPACARMETQRQYRRREKEKKGKP